MCCPEDVIAAGTAWPDAYRMRRHYNQPDWWRGVPGTPAHDAGPVDESPHLDGRAQPGDVLGIETGGERTERGDTAQDEDERRREGIEAASRRDSR